MQQHCSTYFARRPPLDPGGGVKRSNSTFSEHGHVTYQIKGNHECSNMMQLFCPQTPPPHPPPSPPPTQRVVSLRQNSFFSEHGYVAYHIKWIHEYTNMVANILPATPPPPPSRPCGSKAQNSFFLEYDHVAYQKGNHVCSNMVAIFCPHTPSHDPGSQNVKIQLFHNMVMLHIKFKGITKFQCSNMVVNICPQTPPP